VIFFDCMLTPDRGEHGALIVQTTGGPDQNLSRPTRHTWVCGAQHTWRVSSEARNTESAEDRASVRGEKLLAKWVECALQREVAAVLDPVAGGRSVARQCSRPLGRQSAMRGRCAWKSLLLLRKMSTR
jgi:hypothetical protein